MKRVHLITDIFTGEPECAIEAETVTEVLQERFPDGFPAGARIFWAPPDQCDGTIEITPDGSVETLEAMEACEGDVTVIVPPGDPGSALAAIGSFIANNWVAIALTVAAVGVSLLLAPSIAAAANARPGSANNALGGRTNQPAVPGARIDDIQGTVRAYPKLLMVYTKFVNNQEVETVYGAFGRGAYAFETIDGVAQIKDGDTLLDNIAGAKASVYGPNTSPNSGSPEVTIGGGLTESIYAATRMNEIDGQVLPGNVTSSGAGYKSYSRCDFGGLRHPTEWDLFGEIP